MAWYGHPVNEARERAGQLPINSLWLTGPVPQPASGRPRQADQPSGDTLLIGADASLRGVAALSVAPHEQALPAGALAPDTLELAPDLLYARLAGDIDGWLAAWDRVAAGVLDDALERLGRAQIDALEVVATGESRIASHRLARSDRWRPWRAWRSTSLGAQWVDAA